MTPRYYQPIEYRTIWNGRKDDPSLLSDYSRPSSLADVCANKTKSTAKKHRVARNRIEQAAR